MAVLAALAIGFGGGVAYSMAVMGSLSPAEEASPPSAASAEAGVQEPDGGQTPVAAVEESGGESPSAAGAGESGAEAPGGAADLGIDLEGRAFLGAEDAAVTVIEMTDYECPFCRRHRQGVMGELLDRYGDRIRYYALNFPLTSIHPLAMGAAEAAECAHDQGQYWEYAAALFDTDESLAKAVLVSIAADLGMDVPTFSECLSSGSKRGLVISDLRAGERLGVEGTPTFFINGTVVVGARALEIFEGVIDAELASAGG